MSVAAGETSDHAKRNKRGGNPDPIRQILKMGILGEQPKQKYCPLHKRKGHHLTK